MKIDAYKIYDWSFEPYKGDFINLIANHELQLWGRLSLTDNWIDLICPVANMFEEQGQIYVRSDNGETYVLSRENMGRLSDTWGYPSYDELIRKIR